MVIEFLSVFSWNKWREVVVQSSLFIFFDRIEISIKKDYEMTKRLWWFKQDQMDWLEKSTLPWHLPAELKVILASGHVILMEEWTYGISVFYQTGQVLFWLRIRIILLKMNLSYFSWLWPSVKWWSGMWKKSYIIGGGQIFSFISALFRRNY